MENLSYKKVIAVGLVLLVPFLSSCRLNNKQPSMEKKKEYRNMEMLESFSPDAFLPQNTEIASTSGYGKKWIIGDFDGDFLGEILVTYRYQNDTGKKNYMGATILKQEDGKWMKKYDFKVEAEDIFLAKACDITGDKRTDLVLGWNVNSITKEKQIFLYRWQKKELESIGNFTCTDLTIEDFNGIYGKEGQHELGIWTQTEKSLTTDVFRWNSYSTLPVLFPSEYGKLYTEQKLSRAEDVEIVFNRDFVVPKLLTLKKTYPNEPIYDFALIQSYLKAQLTDKALQTIEETSDKLYQYDYEKIPYLKAQAYFIKGEINRGNILLQAELKKTINRVDAGTTLQLLGRSYASIKEWDKAIIAYNNALIFHHPFQPENGFDSENQFQLSLAKDKARLEVMKHFWDLRNKILDQNYNQYFQHIIQSTNQRRTTPKFTLCEFYLSLNNYNDPYATILSWEENGKKKEILFMSIDEDQHKIKFNFAPSAVVSEKTKKGYRLSLTFQEKNITNRTPEELTKLLLIEKNSLSFVIAPE